MAYSGLFQAFSTFSRSSLGNGRDADEGDEGRVAVHVGVVFGQDADGNLTDDGRWSYIWDAENRLIQMTANTSVGPPYQLNFAYDYQGRRIEKIVLIGGGPQSTNLFLYDGWNMVAELKPDNTLIRGYLWGTDLSGSPQGAGGVGGLVEMSYAGTNCFVAYDGNGNVAALVNAADGTVVANYEYGPFGELIRATGPLAKANPIRFSTKYQDDESDLLYYGARYLKTSTGTWLSRDPLQEMGGLNLCGFAVNDPIDLIDFLGLDLEYSSEGEYYYNGNYLDIFGSGSASGKQDSADAWFDESFTEGHFCSGGLCDSGPIFGPPAPGSSSFVKASVKNTGKCSLDVTCHCGVSWNGSTLAHSPSGGFAALGNVLGVSISVHYTPTRSGRVWRASGSGGKGANKTFILGPGDSFQLYFAFISVAVPPGAGNQFTAGMSGHCSCFAK